MNPLRQIRNLVTRGVVSLVNAGSQMQTLQMRLHADEVKDGMEHFEPYGFSAHPHPGAEGLSLFFNGDRSHGVVICVADRQFRIVELQAGEVAIYTDEKDTLIFKRGNVVELTTQTFKINAATAVEIDSPEIRTTGRIVSAGDQIAGPISQINHLHGGVVVGDKLTAKPEGAT